jgi:hypothetical protein
MKHREYRKIIVNDKEYDWLYIADYEWYSCIKVFEVSYIKNNTRKWKKDIRKRKLIKDFEICDYNMQITPRKVRELIEYGIFLSKQEQRKYKLKRLNEKNTNPRKAKLLNIQRKFV